MDLKIPDFLLNQDDDTEVEKTSVNYNAQIYAYKEHQEKLKNNMPSVSVLKLAIQRRTLEIVQAAKNKKMGKNKLLWQLTDELQAKYKEIFAFHNYVFKQSLVSRAIKRLIKNYVLKSVDGKITIGDLPHMVGKLTANGRIF